MKAFRILLKVIMSRKKTNFDPKKVLPPDIAINSFDTHLYRIGLSLFQNGFCKRTNLHNPKIIFIMQLQLWMRCMISLFSSGENRDLYVYIGEFGYFFNARVNIDIAAGLITSLALISQILHYYDYKNNIAPEYLKPFQMISGLISPKSVGLTHEEDVYKLVKFSKISLKVWKFVSDLILFAGFIISFVPFIQNFSTKQFIFFGIIHSIAWGISCYYIYSIIISQMAYFYIICYYLKCKIYRINELLILKTSRRFNLSPRTNLINIIYSLHSIYIEVNEINSNYWSKFLFWIWISLAFIINTLAFESIYGKMDLIVRFILIYVCIIFICILFMVIKTASSVHFEANKSYKLLNSCYLSFSSRRKNNNFKLLKV